MEEQADQVAMGTLLIGIAVLAAFDFWFPGILIVLGVAWIVRSRVMQQKVAKWVWWLLLLGGMLWLRDLFTWLDVARLYPFALIVIGLVLIYRVQWVDP